MRIPPLTNRYILFAIGYGVLILGWLTPEESTVWVVGMLGWGLAYLLAGLFIRQRWGGRKLRDRIWIPLAIMLGAIIGLAAAGLTFLLMLMKNVQHSHLVLDFSNEITLGILERAPLWAATGLFANLAFVLIYLTVRRREWDDETDGRTWHRPDYHRMVE
ncbi:MAG: hypothetical protein L0154_30780 [Chloroflexi bacterium]|nr:hypothetical protein [Chloroflexota bacterium]